MAKYVIGVDFGTLSGRAVLADAADGRVLAASVYEYPHGVMETALPDGTPLPPNWALQHPQDYLDVLDHTIPQVMREAGVPKEDVVAIGTDFTSSTLLPVDGQGTPLCMKEAYAHHPHAYVKLWKHHGAQDEADRMTMVARAREEEWLSMCGGKVSSEGALPKLWQVLREAPEIYAAMDGWVEAGDFIVWQLCGRRTQNMCMAGFKSYYRDGAGFPSEDYFAALDERLRYAMKEKCDAPVLPVGARAGGLTEAMARRLGLLPGIAVSASMVDAHVGVLAGGLSRPGQMLGIIGTSACYMTLGDEEHMVPGSSGVVRGGIVPGCYGYEAGQSCVGDMFGWMAERCAPASYQEEAKRRGISVHRYLTQLAQELAPGESGLIALDWWNGSRTPLMDSNLSGLLIGLTLQTKPEEIYRALIEAVAYGARMIVESDRAHGVPVDEFYVTGGISQKNPMAMQIYADVLGLPVRVIDSAQGGALGSAILGAAAAGSAAGGYDSLREAMAAMSSGCKAIYEPDAKRHAVYSRLYAEYCQLHDLFGRGGNDVMKRLRAIQAGQ